MYLNTFFQSKADYLRAHLTTLFVSGTFVPLSLTAVNVDKEKAYSHLLQANPSAPISMFGQVRGFSYFQQFHHINICHIFQPKSTLFA